MNWNTYLSALRGSQVKRKGPVGVSQKFVSDELKLEHLEGVEAIVDYTALSVTKLKVPPHCGFAPGSRPRGPPRGLVHTTEYSFAWLDSPPPFTGAALPLSIEIRLRPRITH